MLPFRHYGHGLARIKCTALVDSGAKNLYLAADSPHVNFNTSAKKINVGTATGQVQRSTGTAELNIPMIPVFPP